MNMNKIMSMARKNQNEASTQKKVGYSTEVKPPKKLERTVNPDAIKSFLNRKKDIETMQMEENLKKKQHLQKLREDKKNTKRAKAMASRTKDNLKILYNQKPAHQNKPEEAVLSPEAENQHKAFMKRLIASEIHDDPSSESDDGEGKIETERKALRKTEKYQKKARKAANLDFQDLMNLAQEQTQKPSSDSESSSDEAGFSDDMSVQERLEKEKRKRKELEAQLKALKRKKTKNDDSVYKIGKLDKGLSEEDKQAKVKALMEKFKKRSHVTNGVSKSISKTENPRTAPSNKPTSLKKDSHSSSKPSSFQNSKLSGSKSSVSLHKNKNSITKANTDIKKLSQSNASFKAKHASKPGISVSKQSTRSPLPPKATQERTVKRASNPYAQLMQKAKTNAENRCTLSVTNSVVRTNYPGVSQTDPKRPKYQKIAPSREMIEAYRKRALKIEQQPSQKRPRVIGDSDDEYDSEMEGFIDDEDEVIPDSISAEIGKIFRYDRSKYGKESEYELSRMDASYKDIEREEKRSLRIAQKEDAVEAKRLAEEEMRKRKRLKK